RPPPPRPTRPGRPSRGRPAQRLSVRGGRSRGRRRDWVATLTEERIMPQAVVLGATLKCSSGSAPAQLLVTSQAMGTIDDRPGATINDCGPWATMSPSGICQVLTAAAGGTPTLCSMVPAGPWLPGSTGRITLGDQLALLSTDTLKCCVSGDISIVDTG